MNLLSPADAIHDYTSLDLLISDINKHAAKEGYAVKVQIEVDSELAKDVFQI